VPETSPKISRSVAIYNRLTLLLYDLFVLAFSNTFAWRCPTRLILNFYNTHISTEHLDVGVGTGYFLDRCQFVDKPNIALVDLNPNSLRVASRRLRRYSPAVYHADVLAPLSVPSGFDSIGLGFLLHCLPGALPDKALIVFKNLKPLLNADGVVFGTTLVNDRQQNLLAKALLRLYNRIGAFDNTDDRSEALAAALETSFRVVTVRILGSVALFAGRM
jgi:SAM-dependent methyltransferase